MLLSSNSFDTCKLNFIAEYIIYMAIIAATMESITVSPVNFIIKREINIPIFVYKSIE